MAVQLDSVSSDCLLEGNRAQAVAPACSLTGPGVCDSRAPGGDWRQRLREAACQRPRQDLPANAPGSIEMAERSWSPAQYPDASAPALKPPPEKHRALPKQEFSCRGEVHSARLLGSSTMGVWGVSEAGRLERQVIPNCIFSGLQEVTQQTFR